MRRRFIPSFVVGSLVALESVADATRQGQHVSIGADAYGVQRVRLYRNR